MNKFIKKHEDLIFTLTATGIVVGSYLIAGKIGYNRGVIKGRSKAIEDVIRVMEDTISDANAKLHYFSENGNIYKVVLANVSD